MVTIVTHKISPNNNKSKLLTIEKKHRYVSIALGRRRPLVSESNATFIGFVYFFVFGAQLCGIDCLRS